MGIQTSRAVVVLAWTAAATLALPSNVQASSRSGPSWVISPAEQVCRADIELAGRSGASAQVSLESDGQRVILRFAKQDIPLRAFLPIRIDQKPYANLVERTDPQAAAVMVLSEETQVALRKGATLQIAWLADEPLAAPLLGSEQGVSDLKTCGAQVASQYREHQLTAQAERARADADARAKAVSDQQLAAARAQTAAAEAQRQRESAEADRASAEADHQRQLAAQERQRAIQAQVQAQAQAEVERQRAVAAQYYQDDEPPQYWAPPRQTYRPRYYPAYGNE